MHKRRRGLQRSLIQMIDNDSDDATGRSQGSGRPEIDEDLEEIDDNKDLEGKDNDGDLNDKDDDNELKGHNIDEDLENIKSIGS